MPMMFLSAILGTNPQGLFFSIYCNSSSMSTIHFSSLLASLKVLGSISIMRQKFTCSLFLAIILLVCIPSYLFPIICSSRQFFCTYRLGDFYQFNLLVHYRSKLHYLPHQNQLTSILVVVFHCVDLHQL